MPVLWRAVLLSVALGACAQAATSTAPWVQLAGIPGGRIEKIVGDSKRAGVMFAGAHGGILYKSSNGGANWKRVVVGGPSEAFQAIAISPASSQDVYAFSTDDGDSYETPGGIYASHDGGETWARLPNQPSAVTPDHLAGVGQNIVIDRTGQILVMTDRYEGILRSTDAGATWSNPLPGIGTVSGTGPQLFGLTTVPGRSKTLYATGYDYTHSEQGYIWKSTDFGATWSKKSMPALASASDASPGMIAAQPGTGKILATWGGYDPTTGTDMAGVIASDDDGKTWHDSSTGIAGNTVFLNPSSGIAFDPDQPATVYLSTYFDVETGNVKHAVYKSTDSGATWTPAGAGGLHTDYADAVGARPALKSFPSAIFAGHPDLSVSTDHGVTWSRSDTGIAFAQLLSVSDDYRNPSGFYAQTREGLFRTADGGASWIRISNWAGLQTPLSFTVDKQTVKRPVYVTTGPTVRRSADGGATWTDITPPLNGHQLVQLVADPTVGGRVYGSDNNHTLYVWQDSTSSWTSTIVGNHSDRSGEPLQLAVSPQPAGTLYALLAIGIWKSVDGGAHWSLGSLPDPDSQFGSIAVLQVSPYTLFASIENFNGDGAVVRSADGGATWQPTAALTGDLAKYAPPIVMTAPNSPQIFVSTSYYLTPDVDISTDQGTSWTNIAAPLDAAWPHDMRHVAATSGSVFLGEWDGAIYAAPYASLP